MAGTVEFKSDSSQYEGTGFDYHFGIYEADGIDLIEEEIERVIPVVEARGIPVFITLDHVTIKIDPEQLPHKDDHKADYRVEIDAYVEQKFKQFEELQALHCKLQLQTPNTSAAAFFSQNAHEMLRRDAAANCDDGLEILTNLQERDDAQVMQAVCLMAKAYNFGRHFRTGSFDQATQKLTELGYSQGHSAAVETLAGECLSGQKSEAHMKAAAEYIASEFMRGELWQELSAQIWLDLFADGGKVPVRHNPPRVSNVLKADANA